MKKTNVIVVLMAVIAGFIGGAMSSRIFTPQTALAQAGHEKVVRAEKFEVVDKKGKVRIILSGSAIGIFDAGKLRVGLVHDDKTDESTILISDSGGKTRAQITYIGESDISGVTLHDAGGKIRAQIAYVPYSSGVSLYNAYGEQIWCTP